MTQRPHTIEEYGVNSALAAGTVPATVAIVDDQPIPRSGLEHLAAALPGVSVAASVADIDELDASARYDVVILHIPTDRDGLALKTVARVAELGSPLVISTWDRPPSPLAVARAGARGCVLRQSSHDTVAAALGVVASGGFYLCEQLFARFQAELRRPAGADLHGLAPREAETLQWIARGLTHAEIAQRMGLTPATVNTYAKRIRGKLKVSNRFELTRIALELGQPPFDHRSAA